MPSESVSLFHRCLRVAVVAFAAGMFVLAVGARIPVIEGADRSLLWFLLKRNGIPVTDLAGSGGLDDPRVVRGIPLSIPPEELPPPRFLGFGDDPQGIFESNPPSPADLAVVLDNLFTLGHRKVAVAMPLAWDSADAIAAAALDHQLDRFTPGIVGVPVAQGISPLPLPPAFERLSIPLSRVEGATGKLPSVNQLAVPELHFGDRSAVAAFTRLVSETPPDFEDITGPVPVPLLARWDDRLVVSLPLAVLMARFDAGADDLTVSLGREIRLGEHGSIVPIDEFGRTLVEPGEAARAIVTPAEATIRAADDGLPANLEPDNLPLVLRDVRTEASVGDQEYSDHLGDVLVAIDRAPRANLLTTIARPHTAIELLLVGALAGIAAWLCSLRRRLRHPLFALTCLAGVAIAWAMLAVSRSGPPPLALVVTPLAGWMVALGGAGRKARTVEKKAKKKVTAKPVPKEEPKATAKKAKPAIAKPAAAQLVEEKPVEEKPVEEKPVEEKSVEEKSVEEKSVEKPQPASKTAKKRGRRGKRRRAKKRR